MTTKPRIAIIGGGAAGMMAAITAARQGARVTLLERQDRVGRKILATGNGRCNFTNTHAGADRYHGEDPSFPAAVLERFPPRAAVEFFEELGALSAVEDEGRTYPLTGQASTILDVLRLEIGRLGVELRVGVDVRGVERRGDVFALSGSGDAATVDRVIVASGGRAAPHLGGCDAGLRILERLGHRVTPPCPALVPLTTDLRAGRQLKGVRVAGRVTLDIAGTAPRSEEGEVLFTDYGLSGIPILQLSLHASRSLQQGRAVTLYLDLFPAWSTERLCEHLRARCASRPLVAPEVSLIGLVHKRLIPVLLREASIEASSAGAVDAGAIRRAAALLKRWTFAVTGTLSWKDAQVMSGGASTAGFDPAALESRTVSGLFAAGEILDVTGDCGGYNLHWAWASGLAAGMNAARV